MSVLGIVGIILLTVVLFFISLFLWKGFWLVLGFIWKNKVLRLIAIIVALILLVIWVIRVPAMGGLVLTAVCLFLVLLIAKILLP